MASKSKASVVPVQDGPILSSAKQLWANVVEPPFNMLGIGERASPMRRFVVVSLATGLAVWVFKPSYLFDEKGNARGLSITGNDMDGVLIPWYIFSPFVGLLSVLFV